MSTHQQIGLALPPGVAVLQGTFETLTLTEVLGLLARSNKTGALLLEAGPATGVIYVSDGRCHAAESGDQRGKVDTGAQLLVRVVDVCFGVARQEGGSFKFAADEVPDWQSGEAVDLDVAVEELDHLLDEWRDIQLVIPSLDCRVRLSDDLAVEHLPVDRDRWRLLVAIDGRRTVRDLVQRTSRPVLDICHALSDLVEAGAVTVVEPPAQRATNGNTNANGNGNGNTNGSRRKDAPEEQLQQEQPYGPGVESAHPGPSAAARTEAVDDVPVNPEPPADKGEFLRVFSALRDA